MGWLNEAIQTRAASSNISNPANWLFDALGGSTTATGKRVSADSALTYSAVWAAVRLLSETAASLPLVTYERMEPRGKRRASSHPVFSLLHGNVNERQTSFEWIETMMAHLVLRGNSYSWVERDSSNRIKEIFILDPRYMSVRPFGENQVLYSWEPPDLPPLRATAGSGDILHVRGFCAGNGLVGCSPITMARESIALGLSAEQYASKFFANGTTPSGVLEHPAGLDDAGIKRLKESLAAFRSMNNAHKMLVLEEGMKWNTVGISPEDAQMLESRKFQVTEIARWFRVPPHMIGDLGQATFSNIENQGIDFVVHTMRPWLVRIEKAIQRDLLLPEERGKLFVEFLVDALLRGDSKTRSESYAIARQWGWLSVNDIREKENENPIEGGDEYITPMNMVPAGTQPEPNQPRSAIPNGETRSSEDATSKVERELRAKRSANIRKKLGEAMQPVFRDAALSIVRAEKRKLSKPIANLADGGDSVEKLSTLVERFYSSEGELSEFARKAIDPAFIALGETILPIAMEEAGSEVEKDIGPLCESLAASFGERYAAKSRRRLNELMLKHEADSESMQRSLEDELVNWEEVRTETVAKVETVKAKSSIARVAYVAAGVLAIRWVAFGENCPICDSLDGKTVGIEQVFASQGADVGPDGNSIKTRTDITHPPIHDGCDCDITIG